MAKKVKKTAAKAIKSCSQAGFVLNRFVKAPKKLKSSAGAILALC